MILREKATATLLIALFMLSVFAVSCEAEEIDDSSESFDDLSGIRVALLKWPEAILPAMKKMFEWMNCTVMMVSAKDIKNGCLDNFDVLACPGGSGSPLGELGLEGKLKIQDFISGGGGYIGICAGALYACDYFVWIGVPSFTPPFNENVVMGEELCWDLFPGVGYFPIEEISVHTAMTKINIIDHTHPISDSLPDHMQIFYAQSPYLQPYEDANITILGTYDVTGKPAIVAFQYGSGRVFLSGPHPEFEMDSDRDGFPPDPEFSDEGSDWPLVLEAMKWLTPKAGVKIHGEDNEGEPKEAKGISGFPYESIIFGLIVVIIILWRARKF